MNRRELMLSASALAGATLLPRHAFADPNRIDWITSSDQNVIDFWTNVVKPKFEAANAGLTINLVDGGDNAGLIAIASRALAALQTKTDPQVDFFEGFAGGDASRQIGDIGRKIIRPFFNHNCVSHRVTSRSAPEPECFSEFSDGRRLQNDLES